MDRPAGAAPAYVDVIRPRVGQLGQRVMNTARHGPVAGAICACVAVGMQGRQQVPESSQGYRGRAIAGNEALLRPIPASRREATAGHPALRAHPNLVGGTCAETDRIGVPKADDDGFRPCRRHRRNRRRQEHARKQAGSARPCERCDHGRQSRKSGFGRTGPCHPIRRCARDCASRMKGWNQVFAASMAGVRLLSSRNSAIMWDWSA